MLLKSFHGEAILWLLLFFSEIKRDKVELFEFDRFVIVSLCAKIYLTGFSMGRTVIWTKHIIFFYIVFVSRAENWDVLLDFCLPIFFIFWFCLHYCCSLMPRTLIEFLSWITHCRRIKSSFILFFRQSLVNDVTPVVVDVEIVFLFNDWWEEKRQA